MNASDNPTPATEPGWTGLGAWTVALVSPQSAENVGAVARVMKNFGCMDLVLVDPRCDVTPGGPAGILACHSLEVLERGRIVGTLQEALADCHFSAALTMQSSLDRPCDFVGFAPTTLLAGRRSGERRVLVFGREDRGMTNEECSLCSARWSFPTNPAHPSLNLAQSVAVALAGCLQVETCAIGTSTAADPAPHSEVEGLVGHLEQVLVAADYERGVPMELPLRVIRRLAHRSAMSSAEVRVLRGVCRRVLNAILGHERRP